MPRYTITITNAATGETRTGSEEHPTDAAADYLWTEGNNGCDCNRVLYFARFGGEPEPDDPPCGVERFTATVTPAAV